MKNLIGLICILLTSCGNPKNEAPNIVSAQQPKQLSQKYEVIREDTRDGSINLDIYIPDTTNINALNSTVCAKWNPNRDKFILIMYFNDRKVAAVWHAKVADQTVTDAEWAKLDPHRIAMYTFNPSTHFERLGFEKE